MTDDPAPTFEPRDLQWAALAVADGWSDHDVIALAGLTPEGRRQQLEAREALFQLVDDYRHAAKEREAQDVYHAPEWQVVAGMKDLLAQMVARAFAACEDDDVES